MQEDSRTWPMTIVVVSSPALHVSGTDSVSIAYKGSQVPPHTQREALLLQQLLAHRASYLQR